MDSMVEEIRLSSRWGGEGMCFFSFFFFWWWEIRIINSSWKWMSFGWEERDWGYLVRGMWNEGCGIWD